MRLGEDMSKEKEINKPSLFRRDTATTGARVVRSSRKEKMNRE